MDILDRAKARLAPGNCGRSEDTFDAAEGAFIANKSGPVRAIRSYIGANSGPITQREHIFYERREDVRTFLRVHSVPGPLDYFDYSAAAIGMTYKNTNNTGRRARSTALPTPSRPARSPGRPWTVRRAACRWRTRWTPTSPVSPAPRTTWTTARRRPPAPETQCTGDNQAIGASGPWSSAATIPNTDPRLGAANKLNSFRTIYFEAPGKTNGPARSAEAASAFQFSASPLP